MFDNDKSPLSLFLRESFDHSRDSQAIIIADNARPHRLPCSSDDQSSSVPSSSSLPRLCRWESPPPSSAPAAARRERCRWDSSVSAKDVMSVLLGPPARFRRRRQASPATLYTSDDCSASDNAEDAIAIGTSRNHAAQTDLNGPLIIGEIPSPPNASNPQVPPQATATLRELNIVSARNR